MPGEKSGTLIQVISINAAGEYIADAQQHASAINKNKTCVYRNRKTQDA
jgi:hypothetical protein